MALNSKERLQIDSVIRALEHSKNTPDTNEIWRSLLIASKNLHDMIDNMYPLKRIMDNDVPND